MANQLRRILTVYLRTHPPTVACPLRSKYPTHHSVTMSTLQYYAYPEQGVRLREKSSYSQAVRVGDRIECAGQGMICRHHYSNGPIPFLSWSSTWLIRP